MGETIVGRKGMAYGCFSPLIGVYRLIIDADSALYTSCHSGWAANISICRSIVAVSPRFAGPVCVSYGDFVRRSATVCSINGCKMLMGVCCDLQISVAIPSRWLTKL